MTLKEQALEHWRENKRRLKKMDWKEWCNLAINLRRFEVLGDSSSYAPQISGTHCPFCQHYPEQCYKTTSYITRDRCPLYDTMRGGRGDCCEEWRAVRYALIYPTTKKVAMAAVEVMINRIKEIKDEQEINTNTED